MVTYDRSHQRIYVFSRRLHHGFAGVCFTVAGVVLMAHDWADHHEWLRALFVSGASANDCSQPGYIRRGDVHEHGDVAGK